MRSLVRSLDCSALHWYMFRDLSGIPIRMQVVETEHLLKNRRLDRVAIT